LGIQVPELKKGSNAELQEALIRSLPQLVPHVTCFATIGMIWLNHHAMFQGVERVKQTTLTPNLFLLLIIASIPYPPLYWAGTGTLPANAFLYGVLLTLLGITYCGLWVHRIRREPISSARDQAKRATRSGGA
jgi:uncharacterized membrane protein